MNDDNGKFGYDSMQQRTAKVPHLETLRISVRFLTCDVFVFYKNLLCRFRSSHLCHDQAMDVNNSKVQKNTKFTILKQFLKQLY